MLLDAREWEKHFSYLLTKYACQVMSEVQTLSQTSLSHYIFSQWQWQKEKKRKKLFVLFFLFMFSHQLCTCKIALHKSMVRKLHFFSFFFFFHFMFPTADMFWLLIFWTMKLQSALNWFYYTFDFSQSILFQCVWEGFYPVYRKICHTCGCCCSASLALKIECGFTK